MTCRQSINQTVLGSGSGSGSGSGCGSGSGSGCALLLLLRAGSALLYPGPLWRGGRGEESPQDGPHGCGPVFRRHTEVPSENPVTRPRTRKAGCLEGAPSGCRFSLATFSLRAQRESSQRERAPRLALAGRPARQVREAGPGFSSGHPARAKKRGRRGLARCAA